MTVVLGVFLAIWAAAAVFRFVHMYDPRSRYQRWRRWDYFGLVPTGAYFSPETPTHQLVLVVRDVLEDGRTTDWTEVGPSPRRRPLHLVWNPAKLRYRARSEACRDLLLTCRALRRDNGPLPPSFLLSEAYLHLLRYAGGLRRSVPVQATQFAVIEIDLAAHAVSRHVVSAVHVVH